MEGKEAIIASIIEKAEREAAGLVADAEAERDELLAQVRNEEERRKAEALAAASAQAKGVASRQATLSRLEERKTVLAAKQQVVDAAFGEAVKKIHNMTDPVYREFIGGLIEKYADDGDSVVVARRDEKRLHAEWLASVSRTCGKQLTLSSEQHDGQGGVILSGNRCDKNLTLEALLKSLRESALAGVAKCLFPTREG